MEKIEIHKPDLSQLDTIDKKILEVVLNRPGASNTEIGLEVNLTRQAIWLRRQKEPLKSIIEELQQSEIDIFIELRRKALEKTYSLIDSEDEKVSVAICRELIKTIIPTKIDLNGEITLKSEITKEIQETFLDELKNHNEQNPC